MKIEILINTQSPYITRFTRQFKPDQTKDLHRHGAFSRTKAVFA